MSDKEKKWKEILVTKHGERFPFTLMTKIYGRAEFIVCPIFKKGKLVELFVYPAQQPDADSFYHVKDICSDAFEITSWEFKGVELPKIWISSWCNEHKTVSSRVYPPVGTDAIEFGFSGICFSVRFVNTKEEKSYC